MTLTAALERPAATSARAAGKTDDTALPDAHPKVLILRNLIAAMMVGQWHGQQDDVAVILKALSHALDDPRQLNVNLALASALRGDIAPARALLAQDLDTWPSPDEARLTLSLALKIGGDGSWEEEPRRILAISNDSAVRQYAERVLAA
jgi:hypothetical protein